MFRSPVTTYLVKDNADSGATRRLLIMSPAAKEDIIQGRTTVMQPVEVTPEMKNNFFILVKSGQWDTVTKAEVGLSDPCKVFKAAVIKPLKDISKSLVANLPPLCLVIAVTGQGRPSQSTLDEIGRIPKRFLLNEFSPDGELCALELKPDQDSFLATLLRTFDSEKGKVLHNIKILTCYQGANSKTKVTTAINYCADLAAVKECRMEITHLEHGCPELSAPTPLDQEALQNLAPYLPAAIRLPPMFAGEGELLVPGIAKKWATDLAKSTKKKDISVSSSDDADTTQSGPKGDGRSQTTGSINFIHAETKEVYDSQKDTLIISPRILMLLKRQFADDLEDMVTGSAKKKLERVEYAVRREMADHLKQISIAILDPRFTLSYIKEAKTYHIPTLVNDTDHGEKLISAITKARIVLTGFEIFLRGMGMSLAEAYAEAVPNSELMTEDKMSPLELRRMQNFVSSGTGSSEAAKQRIEVPSIIKQFDTKFGKKVGTKTDIPDTREDRSDERETNRRRTETPSKGLSAAHKDMLRSERKHLQTKGGKPEELYIEAELYGPIAHVVPCLACVKYYPRKRHSDCTAVKVHTTRRLFECDTISNQADKDGLSESATKAKKRTNEKLSVIDFVDKDFK